MDKTNDGVNPPPRDAGGSGPDALRAFNDLLDMAVRRLVELGNRTWERNAFLPKHYPDLASAIDALRWLVIRHLFREAGDAKTAAIILTRLRYEVGASESPADRFFRDLTAYVAEALDSEGPAHQGRPHGISLGLVVWGESHVARVAKYSLASLRAAENVPHALGRGAVTGMVQTRRQDAQTVTELLRQHLPGVTPSITILPDALFERVDAPADPRYGPLKYWLLGAAQTLQLSATRQHGDALFSLFPDCIYSSGYVANLMKLLDADTDVVLLSGFAATESGMADMLRECSGDRAYTVPAARLVDTALHNIFPKFRSVFAVPDTGMLPRHLALFFYCDDHITIHSPHYNVAALAHRACARMPKRFFMTLDSELDKFGDARSFHLHDINDDYFATEIRADDSDAESCVAIPYADFIAFASAHLHDEHLNLFRRPYRLELPAGATYPLPRTSDDRVRPLVERICDGLKVVPGEEAHWHRQQEIVAEVTRRAGVARTSATL